MNGLPLFVIVPLGAAILMPVLSRLWKGMSDILGNLATAFLLIWTLLSLPDSGTPIAYHVGGWAPVDGIAVGISMVRDGFTCLMLLIINLIAFVASLYSIQYMSHYTDKGKYYTLYLLMVTGLNGVVLSGDLFNLFVFLEITAIASYALVAFGVEADELEASFKYQVLGGLGSMLILLSIAFFYSLTGTLNLADAAKVLATQGPTLPMYFSGILILIGVFIKSAMMPFHAWLPDAHPSAPAPISAMLSGVVIKVLGIYVFARLFFNVFGFDTFRHLQTLLYILGSASMILGALLAIGQEDLKRLLAYSSISQIGYVFIAFAIATPLSILGGLFHLLNHAVFKSLLFLNAGAIEQSTRTRTINEITGLKSRMPVTTSTNLIGSLSISGLPPFGGFWSKWLIVIAAIQTHQYILATILVLTSIITLAYYLKVQKRFFGSPVVTNLKEAPFFMCISMIVLSILTIGLGLMLIPKFQMVLLDPAVNVLMNGVQSLLFVLGG